MLVCAYGSYSTGHAETAFYMLLFALFLMFRPL